MKDRKDTIGGGPPDVERELGRLAAAPVPTGLRQRVLARAEHARRGAALTPGLATLAVICSIMIVALLILDPIVGGREMAGLAAVLDGRSLAPAAEGLAPELAELLAGDEGGAVRLARLHALATSVARADRPTHILRVRERLKGLRSNEDLEDFN